MIENAEQEEWKERFRAVGKAQGRYLWILLIAGIFYLALDMNISKSNMSSQQSLPLIGIEVDSFLVWASGSFVLGLIILAALGTFPALTYATSRVNLDGERAFERIDTEPTAIDFIVYTKPRAKKWTNISLITYPFFISLGVLESCWLWIRLAKLKPFSNMQLIFLFLGGVALVFCLPRLIGLWNSKTCLMLLSFKSDIIQRIYSAFFVLLEEDKHLLNINSNERSITHRFALYLEKEFPEYHVDCEYNREDFDKKKLLSWRKSIQSDDKEAQTVYPDIIIHQRATKNNLVVIEAKKSSNCNDDDIKKLKAYKKDLKYKYAFFIIFPVRDELHKFRKEAIKKYICEVCD